jgi:drug/metabolite transporter (DMT)-like permease
LIAAGIVAIGLSIFVPAIARMLRVDATIVRSDRREFYPRDRSRRMRATTSASIEIITPPSIPTKDSMPRSLLLLTFLTFAWGMNWPVMKIGVLHMPPLWFRGIGLVLGTLLLGLVLLIRGTSFRMPRGAFRQILLLSFPNVMVWYAVVTVAITMLPAGRAAILGFTMPVWSALIGVLIYREALDRRTAFGVACGVAAIALLVAGDWTALTGHPLGVLLMLIAACAWAWGTHLVKRSKIEMDTLMLTFWMMAFGCPVLLGASAIFEGAHWGMPTGIDWFPILYNAVIVLLIGNVIWFTVARTLPPTTAGLSSMLIPVVGVFSSMAVLGEKPLWRDFVALVLICLAVAIALVPKPTGGEAKLRA